MYTYGCIYFVHPGSIPRWGVSPNALQGEESRSLGGGVSRGVGGGGSRGVGWDPPVGGGPQMHCSEITCSLLNIISKKRSAQELVHGNN